MSPRTSVQIIFSVGSFEISEDILRNQKIIIGLDTFSNQYSKFWSNLDSISLCIEYSI